MPWLATNLIAWELQESVLKCECHQTRSLIFRSSLQLINNQVISSMQPKYYYYCFSTKVNGNDLQENDIFT